MYGPRRIVLSPKAVTTTGKKFVAEVGGRSHSTVGVWYEENGKLYADLRSYDQWYAHVNTDALAVKKIGGVSTQKELRGLIMGYCQNREAVR